MSGYTITAAPFLSETQNTSNQWTVTVRDENGNLEQSVTIDEGARSEQEARKVADEFALHYDIRPS